MARAGKGGESQLLDSQIPQGSPPVPYSIASDESISLVFMILLVADNDDTQSHDRGEERRSNMSQIE